MPIQMPPAPFGRIEDEMLGEVSKVGKKGIDYLVDNFDEFIEKNNRAIIEISREQGLVGDEDDIIALGQELWDERPTDDYQNYQDEEVKNLNSK